MYLAINAGSSSLKFKLFDAGLKEIAGGLVERIGLKDSFLDWRHGESSERIDWPDGMPDHDAASRAIFESLSAAGFRPEGMRSVGHRVVHGGGRFTKPVRLTPGVAKGIAAVSHLAPLHNPANLAAYRAVARLLPKARHVACFDTGFYRTLPDYAYTYALPRELCERHGIRKYGFHGLSHEYVVREAAKRLKRPLAGLKIVSCHLGSGSSVTAVRGGKAIETSMGFTPLAGLSMITRSGDIDPAIPLYLIRELGMTAEAADRLLNFQSGVFGLSGHRDMRDLLSAMGTKVPGYAYRGRRGTAARRQAKLAFDVFCYGVARHIAQYAGLMGGCDAVIFTAGIGERSAPVRKRVMEMVALSGKPAVLVIPTDEERMIAAETRKLLG